jgi:hypothetical protein
MKKITLKLKIDINTLQEEKEIVVLMPSGLIRQVSPP